MKYLYHITHIDNLADIIKMDGLWCDAERIRKQIKTTNIAHSHLKERRDRWPVPVAAGGFVSDYVPFYFAPLSPMLYAIYRGNVEGYEGGQKDVIYLVTSAEIASQQDKQWCFTDGDAYLRITDYYDSLDLLKTVIDWQVMRDKYWNKIPADTDRPRRRKAEFLVYKFFSWTGISGIGTFNTEILDRVVELTNSNKHQPQVKVVRQWYY
ncbi:DUF4433 domain-containing protein [Calditrichota bacterium]